MQVSLASACPKNISQITAELLNLCRRELDDLQLIRECLRDLKSAIGRCARGQESLQLFIALLRAEQQASNELVTFTTQRLQREIAKGRLAGPLIAKEFFFALTIREEDHSVDDQSISSNSSASSSTLPNHPALSLPLLQVAIWSFGCQGIVQESLCSSSQLIELLTGFLTGRARSFALIALVKLASVAEKSEILSFLTGREADIREARAFIEHGVGLVDLESAEMDESEDEIAESRSRSEMKRDAVDTVDAVDSIDTVSTVDSNPAAPRIGKVAVSVQEFLPQNGTLTLSLHNPSLSPITSLSVALAAGGGFDFDYLQAADRSVLPADEQMTLIISLRRRTADLLSFDTGPSSVDYTACKLKMRLQYDFEGETETHISPIDFLQRE